MLFDNWRRVGELFEAALMRPRETIAAPDVY